MLSRNRSVLWCRFRWWSWRDFEQGLIILSFMAVPVASGMTTARLSVLILAVKLFHIAVTEKIVRYDKYLTVAILSYVLVVASIFPQLVEDVTLVLQFITAVSAGLVLMLARPNEPTPRGVILALAVLFTCGLFYFRTMMVGPFTGSSRLDVLLWQTETGLFFGINRYLLALFVVNAVVVFSGMGNTLLRRVFPVFYLAETILLGSKTHFFLALLVVLFQLTKELSTRRSGWLFIAGAALMALFKYERIVGLFEQNILRRVVNSIGSFGDTPRGYIFSVFSDCLQRVSGLIGDGVMECASERVRDLDNTFFFVVASGGFVSLLLFLAFIAIQLYLLGISKISVPGKIYLALGFLLLLNVDVLISKAFIFFPALLYVFNREAVVGSTMHAGSRDVTIEAKPHRAM